MYTTFSCMQGFAGFLDTIYTFTSFFYTILTLFPKIVIIYNFYKYILYEYIFFQYFRYLGRNIYSQFGIFRYFHTILAFSP